MTNRNIDDLVDGTRGIVSREIFADDAIFQDEQQRIFGRAWLFVGHEDLIPQPNDYSCPGWARSR